MGRRLGQHFLRSTHVLDAILAHAAPQPGQPVLEIGPGEGVLTERLLATGARVTAIEVDPQLDFDLHTRWGSEPRFKLIREDVRKADLSAERLFGSPEPYLVVANLPYYLSTPLLFQILPLREQITRLVVMLQKEVVDRMRADPADGKRYGSLSVATQYAFYVKRLLTVPPSAFEPPPKVYSAVIELRSKVGTLTTTQEVAFLEHMKQLFTKRRKVLFNNIRGLYPDLSLVALGRLERQLGMRRGETLSPAEHLALFRALDEARRLGTAVRPWDEGADWEDGAPE